MYKVKCSMDWSQQPPSHRYGGRLVFEIITCRNLSKWLKYKKILNFSINHKELNFSNTHQITKNLLNSLNHKNTLNPQFVESNPHLNSLDNLNNRGSDE